MTSPALPPQHGVARVVVWGLAALTMLTGALGLGFFTFLLLFTGVPWWVVAPLLVGVVLTIALAGRQVRASRERHGHR